MFQQVQLQQPGEVSGTLLVMAEEEMVSFPLPHHSMLEGKGQDEYEDNEEDDHQNKRESRPNLPADVVDKKTRTNKEHEHRTTTSNIESICFAHSPGQDIHSYQHTSDQYDRHHNDLSRRVRDDGDQADQCITGNEDKHKPVRLHAEAKKKASGALKESRISLAQFRGKYPDDI
mmetsp:Transcript_3371/g.7962  ORF Transcript_3371/g.7962 Transcript_3371/m.7962 type:complete len:174 (+) Transcript_3371:400-921(+)